MAGAAEETVASENEKSAEEEREDGGGGEEEADLHVIHGGKTKSTWVPRVTCLMAIRRFTQWTVKVIYCTFPAHVC